jgi:hypothetical protein
MIKETNDLTRRDKLLLKEYELCQNAAQSLESTIWQTSAVIGIGSLGSLALVAKERLNWLPAVIIGFVAIFASCTWWRMARRWWSIQHTKFYRMRHIERDIDFYQVRYLDYLDALEPLKEPKSDETESKKAELKKKLLPSIPDIQEDLDRLSDKHQSTGTQSILKCFRCINLIAWAVYMAHACLYSIYPCLCSNGILAPTFCSPLQP